MHQVSVAAITLVNHCFTYVNIFTDLQLAKKNQIMCWPICVSESKFIYFSFSPAINSCILFLLSLRPYIVIIVSAEEDGNTTPFE